MVQQVGVREAVELMEVSHSVIRIRGVTVHNRTIASLLESLILMVSGFCFLPAHLPVLLLFLHQYCTMTMLNTLMCCLLRGR